MFQNVKFDQFAVKYIKEELQKGNKLAEALLSIDFSSGVIEATLPTELSRSETLDFSNALSITHHLNVAVDLRYKIIDYVFNYLHTHEQGIAIFETLATQEDKWINTLELSNIVYDSLDNIYYINDAQSNSRETIERGFQMARDYPFICALLTYKKPLISPLPDEIFQDLATITEVILCGAYDCEGYLIWKQQI